MAGTSGLHIAGAIIATLLLVRPPRVSCFPSYQDPFVAGPPILGGETGREPTTPCTSLLFDDASFPKKKKSIGDDARDDTDDDDDDDGPGYVVDYHAPTSDGCVGPWNRVVLRVTGTVDGVQYDRVGYLVLNGVELLRLTTPEPAGGGVTTWHVERDVTAYSPIFAESRRGGVRVFVGNIVDKTYTGVIHITAELLFYPSKSASDVVPVKAASYVRGLLSNAPIGNGVGMDKSVWAMRGIKGNETLDATVTLPFRNAVRAHVDLYASAHGCEEFWYTNPPTSYSKLHPSSSGCGGGAARELVLYIDGMVAGVVPPFPVIYSGGINPLLWRPQGGIRSFSVSPYTVDVTPFLALLNDGREHTVSVGVTSNSDGGSWYPNPILVVYRDIGEDDDAIIDGNITLHEYSTLAPEPIVVNKTLVPHTDISFVTTRSSTLRVVATFRGPQGDSPPRHEETYFSVSSINTNSIGKIVGETHGGMNATVKSTAYGRNETLRFPYSVWSSFEQGSDDTFKIVANVSQGQHWTVHYFSEEKGSKLPGTLVFMHELRGNATYNRSTTEDRTPHVEESSTAQRFGITLLGGEDDGNGEGDGRHCFEQEITARDGYVDHSSVWDGRCTPVWFCSVFDACSATVASPPPVHDVGHAQVSRFYSAVASPDRFAAVRHPRRVRGGTDMDDQ